MRILRTAGTEARHALGRLHTHPALTAGVVLTLALGAGAAASLFAVADALLLRPLPFRDADRWVEVLVARPGPSFQASMSAAGARPLREASSHVFDGFVAFASVTLARTDGPGPEALSAVAVTPGADTLLGIPLLLGRSFTAEDARPGAAPVAVLSRSYWERLGADRSVLGRTLHMESGPATVVGVLRERAAVPDYAGERDVWIPLRDDFTFADRTRGFAQGVWARLPAGATRDGVEERAGALAAALHEARPVEGGTRVRLAPLGRRRAQPDILAMVRSLAGAVGAMFLLAVVNALNLALMRAAGRARELAIRRALGATPRRVLGGFLAEGLALGLAGGAAAAIFAWITVSSFARILPERALFFTPHAFDVEGRTLLFVAGASLLAGLAVGLAPALVTVRWAHPSTPLTGRSGGDAPRHRRLRGGLATLQVALSTTLVAVAGLFSNGFVRLLSEDPGFDYRRLAMAAVHLSGTRYAGAPARADLVRRLEEALEAHPAVDAVAVIDAPILAFGAALEAEGRPPRSDQPTTIPYARVPEDYFRTVGIDIVEGRALRAGDAGTDAAVVDRDLARFLWGGAPASGRRFRVGEDGEWRTVVGVARELRLLGRDQRAGPYQLLLPRSDEGVGEAIDVAVRTSGRPEALLPVFRTTLATLDPEQWIWRLRTGAHALAEEEDTPRFLVAVTGVLAALALALAAVGLYAVLAHSVRRRRRELGVRIAVGATPGRIGSMVLGEGLRVALLGCLLGAGGALAAGGALERLLYDVSPADGATLGASVAALLAVVAAASFAPAARAARVDPAELLREE